MGLSTCLAVLLTAASGGVALGAPPATEDQLVTELKAALLERDLAALEELVNWEGASKMRRRAVTYQLRSGLGRPIRSIAVEPFPADGFREIEERGTLRPNMPVSQQVRVVFDEPDNPYGRPPTAVFLVGKEGEAYRIALVVPTRRPGEDRR
jgi:hypothetical protein